MIATKIVFWRSETVYQMSYRCDLDFYNTNFSHNIVWYYNECSVTACWKLDREITLMTLGTEWKKV